MPNLTYLNFSKDHPDRESLQFQYLYASVKHEISELEHQEYDIILNCTNSEPILNKAEHV